MTHQPAYAAHSVIRSDHEEGEILLRSGLKLGPVARNTGEWLHRWAAETPDRTFLMERSGEGWRQISYGETLQQVQSLAATFLDRGMGQDTPIVVLSGPGIDHGVLQLAAQYVGVPVAPLAEQYSMIPDARPRLSYCANKIKPKMVFAANGGTFADALDLEVFEGVEKLVSQDHFAGAIRFDDALRGNWSAGMDHIAEQVGPQTLAKILFTSGSTGNPKGVPQSQLMLTVNQAQYSSCLPLLAERPPIIVDWLPWNHCFAGNSNFNMVLSNGGTLILDDGKPVNGLFDRTLENLSMHVGTLSVNVPIAYTMLVDAFRKDRNLRHRFFADLDMIFYAGASLPKEVWTALEDMSHEVRGRVPMMTSSWGLTETAPACLIHHEGGAESGMIGVPVPELDVKLIPYQGEQYEIRVRGPNVITSYFDEAKADASSFDEEGYFITKDAVQFVDPKDMCKGVRFDGRISEDFKLLSGTRVQAAKVRMDVLAALEGLIQDVVVTGADRNEIGLLIFPTPDMASAAGEERVLLDKDYLAEISRKLGPLNKAATGSSNRICRYLVMAGPPSVKDGEITAKGSLNISSILTCRADLLDRLYDDTDKATIRL